MPTNKKPKKSSKSRKSTNRRPLRVVGKSFSQRSAFIFAGVFGLIGVIVLLKTFAASPQPMSFALTGTTDTQYPVEQQSPGYFYDQDWSTQDSWVTNPYKYIPSPSPGYVQDICLWDVDDQIHYSTSGKLAPGASALVTICVVADQYDNFGGDDHMLTVKASNTTPDIAISLTSDQGFSTALTPVKVGKSYEWKTCKVDHTPGPYPTIENSNGGTGKLVKYTVKVTNTSRQTRSPYVRFEHPLVGTPEWFTEHNAGCV